MFLIRCIINVALIIGLLIVINIASDFLSDVYLQDKMQQTDRVIAPLGRPYITVNLANPTTTLHRGETFYVNYHVIRTKLCAFDYTIYIMSMPDEPHQITMAFKTVSSWTPAGKYEFNEMYEMPKNLPFGKYHITKKFVNHCGARDTYYTTGYDVAFTLADAIPSP